MLFMVIERFKGGNALPVYRLVRERGRMLPEGLIYVDRWIEANFGRCFQRMECDDPGLFQWGVASWIAEVGDLVEFEIVPVVPSRETAENAAPLL